MTAEEAKTLIEKARERAVSGEISKKLQQEYANADPMTGSRAVPLELGAISPVIEKKKRLHTFKRFK